MDIKVDHISKAYGEQQVLQDLSCVFPEGKTTCIRGRSGSGKTTLIQLLLRLDVPDKGKIEGISDRKLSAVFQEDRLCENLSAASNIRLVCTETITDRELEEAYKAVALTEIWQKPVRELSGGMRRRVSILRALLAESDCVIMDEPLRGLDEKTRAKTIDYINTNNPVINTLINSKIAYAKSENIITAIDITKDIKPMTGNDLCSIIGNVIDNAIEAELHEEESLRQLHIQAYWDDEEMVFHVSNYINETVLDRNSGLATTKEDKNSHGLGTNIVKSLAKRNYGTCDYYETENEFHCEIRW